jgi:catechol 2,3-dioxygenase-like lactoylglutathione lyase family enzyme
MRRTWPIIGVRDVPASSRWYQSVLGCPNTHQDGSVFDQVIDGDETVLICLHHWGDHGHPSLISPEVAAPGNGLLLFFRVDDFEAALTRARALTSEFEEEPHTNPNTGTMEFSLRDPDGYYVTVNELLPS